LPSGGTNQGYQSRPVHDRHPYLHYVLLCKSGFVFYTSSPQANIQRSKFANHLFIHSHFFIKSFFFLWRFDPIPFHGLPLQGFVITHRTHSVSLLRTSDQSDAGTSTRKKHSPQKTQTSKRPCSQRDSNSQSQYVNGCRPIP